MTAADDRSLNPDLWDSDGNLLVPRHGIRIAMGLALAAAGAYWLFAFIADREMRRLNPLQPSQFPEFLLGNHSVGRAATRALYRFPSAPLNSKPGRDRCRSRYWSSTFSLLVAIFSCRSAGVCVDFWAYSLRPRTRCFELDIFSLQRLDHCLCVQDCVQSRLGDVLSDPCRHASRHDFGIPLTRRSLIFSQRPAPRLQRMSGLNRDSH